MLAEALESLGLLKSNMAQSMKLSGHFEIDFHVRASLEQVVACVCDPFCERIHSS